MYTCRRFCVAGLKVRCGAAEPPAGSRGGAIELHATRERLRLIPVDPPPLFLDPCLREAGLVSGSTSPMRFSDCLGCAEDACDRGWPASGSTESQVCAHPLRSPEPPAAPPTALSRGCFLGCLRSLFNGLGAPTAFGGVCGRRLPVFLVDHVVLPRYEPATTQ